MQNSFAETALPLLAAGYSPIPMCQERNARRLQAGSAIAMPRWQGMRSNDSLRRGPLTVLAWRWAGLLAIDIDTADKTIVAAIRSVVPASPIAKRGRKGRTDFYRDKTKTIRARKFSSDFGMLVEVLAHGNQTIVPPSLHPDTGLPYVWLGPHTLENTQLRHCL